MAVSNLSRAFGHADGRAGEDDPPTRFFNAGITSGLRAAHQDPNLLATDPLINPRAVFAIGASKVEVGLIAVIIVLPTPTTAPATPATPAKTADAAPTVCLMGNLNAAPFSSASSPT